MMAGFAGISGGSPFVQAGGMDANDPWGSYNSAYKAAAATNTNLYNQTMGGYAQMIAQANAAQQQNQQGYVNLQRGVMRNLRGSNRANIQDIADQYTRASGVASQQMIDRGLGNTTIQQSVQRGVEQDFAKERTRSQGMFAQLVADYRSKLGLSRLQAQQQGIGMMSGLQGQQLGYLASIAAPYPDPGMYAAMAAQLSGGGGGGGMGFTGGAPGIAPTGGYAPPIPQSGGMDFFGGGGGGMGGWATGYNAPSWNQGTASYGGGDPYGAVGGGLASVLGPGASGMASYAAAAGDYGGSLGLGAEY